MMFISYLAYPECHKFIYDRETKREGKEIRRAVNRDAYIGTLWEYYGSTMGVRKYEVSLFTPCTTTQLLLPES